MSLTAELKQLRARLDAVPMPPDPRHAQDDVRTALRHRGYSAKLLAVYDRLCPTGYPHSIDGFMYELACLTRPELAWLPFARVCDFVAEWKCSRAERFAAEYLARDTSALWAALRELRELDWHLGRWCCQAAPWRSHRTVMVETVLLERGYDPRAISMVDTLAARGLSHDAATAYDASAAATDRMERAGNYTRGWHDARWSDVRRAGRPTAVSGPAPETAPLVAPDSLAISLIGQADRSTQ